MAKSAFLKIANSLEKAWDLDESPVVDLHYLDQIQLLPKDKQPYLQITDGESDLSVTENYEVYLVDCKTGTQEDITAHVDIASITVSGITQLKIQLAYLPTDHYENLQHLKINRDSTTAENTRGKYYYSNPFLVTDTDKQLTTRVDYTLTATGKILAYQSIRLRFYKNNKRSATELSSYFQITTGQLTNSRTQTRNFIEWQTKPFNAFAFERLENALYLGRCYFNQIRQYPAEPLQYNSREGNSNISEMKLITDPNENDFLNIINVIIGATLIDFRVNVPSVLINDPNNYLVTQTKIPA